MSSPDPFLDAFEQGTLPRVDWTHAAHVRVAWLYLEAHPFAEALELVRTGIRRYNASVGSRGYHETVTTAFVMVVQYRRLLADPRSDWSHFVATNPDLLAAEPFLGRYYTGMTLGSSEARDEFLAPDRRPLPAAGDLRMATEHDAAAFVAIYAPFVEATTISFEVVAPTVPEMAARITKVLETAPWLVYEVDGEVAGYAYGSRHRERSSYKWSVDVSVYVAPPHHRRGVGKLLYANLLRILPELGFVSAFAGITLPNPASVSLHEGLGFSPIGIYHAVGFKHGAWRDVGWWELRLLPLPNPPPELRRPGDVAFVL